MYTASTCYTQFQRHRELYQNGVQSSPVRVSDVPPSICLQPDLPAIGIPTAEGPAALVGQLGKCQLHSYAVSTLHPAQVVPLVGMAT